MNERTPARWLRPRSWPVAVRLALDLSLAALIPLTVALWFSLARGRDALERAAEEHLVALAAATADRLDQIIAETSRAVRAIAGDEDIGALAFAAAEGGALSAQAGEGAMRALAVALEVNPQFASAFVTDRRGVGVISTNPRNVGQDISFREYVRTALAGSVAVSDLIVGKTSGAPGVYCAAPIPGHDGGAPIGAAVIKLRVEAIWEALDAIPRPAETFPAVVDRNGVIIAHPVRELLFRSLGPLPPERIARIDPELSYSQSTIQPVGLPDLMPVATDDSASGSVMFTIPAAFGLGDSSRRVAGYAAMSQRPWKVFLVQAQSRADAAATALVQRQLAIAGVVSALAVVMALVRARSIVRPIRELGEAADRLGTGDFSARAPKHADDEIGRLADAFNRMAPRLQESVALKQSLEVAMEVQQSLLPACNPTIAGLDIAGRTRYCDQTGGDYYDFIDVSEPHPGAALLAVGDVTGHGVGAALLMASARAALRARAIDEGGLSLLLDHVNAVLVNDRDVRFMTMMLLLIDPKTGSARWASAGHDPAIVFCPAAGGFEEFTGGGIPLGIERDYTYEEHERAGLRPGQALVVGTDGVWEAPNLEGEMFGKDRLRDVIRETHDRSAPEIARAIEDAVDAFRGAAAQKDDITFVVVKVCSVGAPEAPAARSARSLADQERDHR